MKVFILLCLVFNVVFAGEKITTKLIRQDAVSKTVILKLKSGWNLVSLPGYQPYFASTFFNNGNVDRILSYNQYINQWMSYYTANEAHFTSLVLYPGIGYWVKAYLSFNIAISSDHKTSVIHLANDELAQEILESQLEGNISVNGVNWMKAVFRSITFNDAQDACSRNNARLPTVEELFNFYKHTSVSSSNFNGDHIFYWTSSEFNKADRKWIIDFGTGAKALQHIDTYNSARCLLY